MLSPCPREEIVVLLSIRQPDENSLRHGGQCRIKNHEACNRGHFVNIVVNILVIAAVVGWASAGRSRRGANQRGRRAALRLKRATLIVSGQHSVIVICQSSLVSGASPSVKIGFLAVNQRAF